MACGSSWLTPHGPMRQCCARAGGNGISGSRHARRDARQALPAGHCGQDLDFLPVGHRRREPVAEADVLAVDVDVDEPAQPAVAVGQAIAQLAVALEEGVEHSAHGGAVDAHRALAACGFAQLGRELDLRHQTRTSAPSTSATNWSNDGAISNASNVPRTASSVLRPSPVMTSTTLSSA